MVIRDDLPLVAVRRRFCGNWCSACWKTHAGHPGKMALSSFAPRRWLLTATGPRRSSGLPDGIGCRVGHPARGPRARVRLHYYLTGGRPIVGLGDNSANLAVVQNPAQAGGGDMYFGSKPGGDDIHLCACPRPRCAVDTDEDETGSGQSPAGHGKAGTNHAGAGQLTADSGR